MIFWTPPKVLGHFFGSTHCSTYDFSSTLQIAQLNYCCSSWWSFHGTDSSKMLVSSAATGWNFQQFLLIDFLHGAKTQLLWLTHWILGLRLPLRLHLHQWDFMLSHHAKLQLFSMIPSCFQNQCQMCEVYTLPSTAASMSYNLATSATQLLCVLREQVASKFTSVMLFSS